MAGGHAVDPFRSAMNISEKTGVLPRIGERATGTTRMSAHQEGSRRPVRVDLTKIFDAASDRHVEIMRDDLSAIHHDAARDDVEHLFGDSITQLRMDTWSRGSVTLVGDAGYCPGPAVGGSTSLAVVGASVLAGEPARTDGDHERAFPAYERARAEHIRGSRAGAPSAAKTLVPTSRLGVWGLARGARLISSLPAGPGRALLVDNTVGTSIHELALARRRRERGLRRRRRTERARRANRRDAGPTCTSTPPPPVRPSPRSSGGCGPRRTGPPREPPRGVLDGGPEP
ncbi:hypothetical protein [Streptomyces sp. PanSC19]|uniref:hypothetical protein n=1 Tax=Streptomyces sp. PanSC19 TaxID=1520455 RepID=UPI0021A4B952|nr:hypothetical protein [Streptomyces sp. PanSC19]